MFETILGIILLALPFLAVNLFSDKKKGFIYVLFFSLLFQTALAITTQFFGVFYYNVVMCCTLFADIIVLFVCFLIKIKNRQKFVFNFQKIDWVVFAVIIISFLTLFQVHYNYTGKINLATDQVVSYHEVEHMKYVYPYFSDEWYAVSLIEGSINSHSLPIKNILTNNTPFLNLELFFHSFLAEIFVILNLNVLTQYTLVSNFINTLIIVLIYIFLRISKVSALASGVSSLLALYIACGANLPGLWHLIPFTLGIVIFLISACFMEFNDVKMAIASMLLASFFYPPLIPFFAIAILGFLFFKINLTKQNIFRIVIGLILLFIFSVLGFYALSASPLQEMVNYIISRLFFTSFVAPSITQLYFYRVIPLPVILFAIIGLYFIYKNKKWIFAELTLCAMMWLFYSLTVNRFFIEYERMVIFTSIIAVIISGFGLKFIEDEIKKEFQKKGEDFLKITEISIIFIFLLLVPYYTQGRNWGNFILVNPSNNVISYPKSPANNYLTEDDLRVFKDIKGKKFLSISWKGTVIGVATGNYPVVSKAGTISIGQEITIDDFLNSDCAGKTYIARLTKVEYVYMPAFECVEFQKIDESQEGLVLYKVVF